MKEVNLKSVPKLPLRLFIILIIMLALNMVFSAEDVGTKTVTFKARISEKSHWKTYRYIRLKENNFVTGIEGDVTWKPKSFYEAFILENVVKESAALSLLNILYLIVFDGLLFWMVKDIEEDKIFNEKVIKGLNLLSIFAALWMVKGILQFCLSNYYIKEITNGQFEAVVRVDIYSILPFLLVGTFSQILSSLILKGQKIEQEQKLTV